ncbi:MAG: M20/M25/M40 family metallo-hydrolase [Candidatus Nanopelagicales bacterium]|nr:M20/M25/M40 family metallo-hydrolase [Candidatus Nanopelagicales bacterium]
MTPAWQPLPAAEAEVVELLADLIKIDTSNWGDSAETVGEIAAANYCADRLREAGWDPEVFTTSSAGRAGVYLRIAGTDPSAPALLLHGHLDVVPAMANDWSHPPFAAEIDGGFVWGRGAVDMKDMDAMILVVVRGWGFTGIRPRRDVVVLFLPDEEAGSGHGSHWLAANRPEMFLGVSEAVGEVGGFSVTVRDDLRLYPIQTAEKGIRWIRLRARGRAGHGSMLHDDNAITELCDAVTRVANYNWPLRITKTVETFLDGLGSAYGVEFDPQEPEELLRKLGTLGAVVGATMRNTANPSMFSAGYKHNVIPSEAIASIDGRVIPGYEEEFESTIKMLVGDRIAIETAVSDIAIEAPFDTATVDLMASVLRAEDPGAHTLPYMMSGGTDAKAFSRFGIDCYGFSPLQMPADVDYWRLFHGIDERVSIDGLKFGVRVLDRFLRAC